VNTYKAKIAARKGKIYKEVSVVKVLTSPAKHILSSYLKEEVF